MATEKAIATRQSAALAPASHCFGCAPQLHAEIEAERRAEVALGELFTAAERRGAQTTVSPKMAGASLDMFASLACQVFATGAGGGSCGTDQAHARKSQLPALSGEE